MRPANVRMHRAGVDAVAVIVMHGTGKVTASPSPYLRRGIAQSSQVKPARLWYRTSLQQRDIIATDREIRLNVRG